jgi:hypothetical protein
MILTRASPPTIPDPSDSPSTLVRVLPPTPTSATEAEPSSTTSLPSTPHSSPSESVSQPVPPRRVRGQRFPAVRPPEQSTPTPAKADLEATPHLHHDRVPLSFCRAIYPSHISMPSLLPRSNDLSPCRYYPEKVRANLSSRPSRRSAHPEAP